MNRLVAPVRILSRKSGLTNFTPHAPIRLAICGFSSSGETVVSRCQSKIAEALNPTHLVVQGMHDDPNGSHIIVEVVSEAFEGKRPVARQRMVYQALWEEMSAGGALHAVDSIIAKTPSEYGK
jgi:stress-induced morphogen